MVDSDENKTNPTSISPFSRQSHPDSTSRQTSRILNSGASEGILLVDLARVVIEFTRGTNERTNEQRNVGSFSFWLRNDVLSDLSSEDVSCGKAVLDAVHTANVLDVAMYHVRCPERSETNGDVSCQQTMSFAAPSDDGIHRNAVARGIPRSTSEGTSARTVLCATGCVDDGNAFRLGEEFSSPHWRIHQSMTRFNFVYEISLYKRLGGGTCIR